MSVTAPKPVAQAAPVRWQQNRAAPTSFPDLPLTIALARGFAGHCPACGGGELFQGYLRVSPECTRCGAPLGLARADDAPPYFTIFVVGHLLVPALFLVERHIEPPLWVEAAIFLPLAAALSLALLRPIKGATVGLMLKLGLLKSGSDE